MGYDGNSKVSFTSRVDVGRFVAHVLTKLPPSELQNKVFRIQGDEKVTILATCLARLHSHDLFTDLESTLQGVRSEDGQEARSHIHSSGGT